MDSSSSGANVRRSWQFTHKRNAEMEEEVPIVNSVSVAIENGDIAGCWQMFSGGIVCGFVIGPLLGTATGARPSRTTHNDCT